MYETTRRPAPLAPAPREAKPDLAARSHLRALDGYAAQAAALSPVQLRAAPRDADRTKDGKPRAQPAADKVTAPPRTGAGGETALVGPQALYATPARVADSNAKLATAGNHGSFLRLETGADTVAVGGKQLHRVEPTWHDQPGAGYHQGAQDANAPGAKDSEGRASRPGQPMALWTDCGRASSAIMGATVGDRSAIYRGADGTEKRARGKLDKSVFYMNPANALAHQVYLDAIPGFIALPENARFLREGVHGTRVDDAAARTLASPATVAEAKVMYWELGDEGRLAFDKATGTNAYANPEVGEAYLATTEREMPGFAEASKRTWNFHWAGVVMKDGSDNITLEAFAVAQAKADKAGVPGHDYIDRRWHFEVYGGVGADGELVDRADTFHERHLATREHGNRAATLRAQTDRR